MNFGVRNKPDNKLRASEIRATAVELIDNVIGLVGTANENQIMVTEVQCTDEGCVPLETLMIVLGSGECDKNNRWIGKVLKPLREVTKLDTCKLLSTMDWKIFGIDISQPTCWEARLRLSVYCELISGSVEPDLLRNFLLSLVSQACPIPVPVTYVAMKSTVPVVSTASKYSNPPMLEPSQESKITTNSAVSKPARAELVVMKQTITAKSENNAPLRHEKETRLRGCPCCDPDNIDNIVDKMLFSGFPPS